MRGDADCHTSVAERSESEIKMVAGGNHTTSNAGWFAMTDLVVRCSKIGAEIIENYVIASQCAHWRGNPFSCNAKHCVGHRPISTIIQTTIDRSVKNRAEQQLRPVGYVSYTVAGSFFQVSSLG